MGSSLPSIYTQYKEGTLSVRMQAPLFYIQLPYTTNTRQACSLSEWKLLSSVYSYHIQPIQGRHSLSECRPLPSIYSCHLQPVQGRHSLCQNAGPSLPYTAAIYNQYKEGTLLVRMEASLFCIQLPYTTNTRKPLSLSACRPLPSIYSYHIQPIQGRHSLCQNGNGWACNNHKKVDRRGGAYH